MRSGPHHLHSPAANGPYKAFPPFLARSRPAIQTQVEDTTPFGLQARPAHSQALFVEHPWLGVREREREQLQVVQNKLQNQRAPACEGV